MKRHGVGLWEDNKWYHFAAADIQCFRHPSINHAYKPTKATHPVDTTLPVLLKTTKQLPSTTLGFREDGERVAFSLAIPSL